MHRPRPLRLILVALAATTLPLSLASTPASAHDDDPVGALLCELGSGAEDVAGLVDADGNCHVDALDAPAKVLGTAEGCLAAAGADAPDADDDGVPDGCDDDRDGDGVPNDADNCPDTHNPSQEDRYGEETSDPDGIGDSCQEHDGDEEADEL